MNQKLLISLMLVPLWLFVTDAEAYGGTVQGTVRDPLGALVVNAKIELLADHSVLVSTVSDSKGEYHLVAKRAGRFQLRATAPSFAATDSESFYLGESEARNGDLLLRGPHVVQQMVITATGVPTSQAQVGAPVTLLTPEDYQNRLDIYDPLGSVPGLQVTQTGRRGGITSLFIRGGNSDANKLLIDGIPANDIGGDVDFGLLSATAVDHLEVFRGPNSVLYGSDALAGVVTVSTTRGKTPLPELTYSADGGNFSTYRQEATIGGAWRQFDYFSAFSHLNTGNGIPNDAFHNGTFAGNFGWSPLTNNSVRLTVRRFVTGSGNPNGINLFGIPDNAQGQGRDTLISATYDNQATTKWHNLIRYGASRLDNRFNKPSPVGILEPGVGFLGAPVTLTGANGFSTTGQAFFSAADCCPETSISTANRDTVYAQTDYAFNSHVNSLFAFRYEAERGFSSFFSPTFASNSTVDRRNMGFVLETHGEAWQKLFYSVGGGIEKNAVFGTEATPRVSLAYYPFHRDTGLFRNTKLFFNFGKGIKEPSIFDETSSLFDLLHQQPGGDQLIQQFGIRPIGAERSRSYDGGIEQWLTDRLLLNLNVFHNQFTDVIEFVSSNVLTQLGVSPTVAAASGFGAAINSSDFRAEGVETEINYSITKSLRARGGYTYTDARVQKSFSSDAISPAINPLFPGIPIGANEPLIGARPFRRAPHTGFLSVVYNQSRWSALLQGTFVGRRDDSTFLEFSDANFGNTLLLPNRNLDRAYQKLDLSGNFRVNKHLLVYASMENLLNQRYDAAFGFPSPPFGFRSGIKITLGGESWGFK